MNQKAANTAKTATKAVPQKDKDAAKQCLMLADKYLKEGDFEKARTEVSKAQQLDPSNPYAYAFLDRISHFEEQQKKEAPPSTPPPKPTPPPVPPKQEAPKPTPPPAPPKQEAPKPTPPPAPPKQEAPKPPPPKQEAPKPTPPPPREEPPKPSAKPVAPAEEESEKAPAESPVREPTAGRKDEEAKKQKKADPESVVEATRPVISDVMSSRMQTKPPSGSPGIADVIQEMSSAAHGSGGSKGDIDTKLDEMKRQIEMLTKALDSERKVREEMNQQQLKGAVKQLRSAMEKAWMNGAPKDEEIEELHELALSLGVPEDVEHTLNREVKLDMYSRAVKEVVAKQKLIRNSSRTLDWLRKVYQVSMDEYLEYESKFLMDLVADQYKGTILFVSSDQAEIKDIGQKLKSLGYAVVTASSPENALEKIEKINPHFILCDTDFSQGYLSGIKFLHVLRANSKFNYIPFILLCGEAELTQLKSSELRPTEGYVEKPVEIETLSEMMNEKLMAFRKYLSSI